MNPLTSIIMYILLLICTSPAVANALEDCDDNEVIHRICGEWTENPPLQNDGTGIGLTKDDIEYQHHQRIEANDELWRVSDEGRWRYIWLARGVRRAIRSAFKATPISQQRRLEEKLRSVRFGIEDYDTSFGAYYGYVTKKITITPALLNSRALSDAAFIFILGHELGHHLEEDRTLRWGHLDKDLLSKNARQCFESTFPYANEEDLGDWIGSIILAETVRQITDQEKRSIFAKNGLRVFCSATNPGWFEELTGKSEAGITAHRYLTLRTHTPPRDRMLTAFRQPILREAIGCSPKVIEHGRQVRPCSLDGWQ